MSHDLSQSRKSGACFLSLALALKFEGQMWRRCLRWDTIIFGDEQNFDGRKDVDKSGVCQRFYHEMVIFHFWVEDKTKQANFLLSDMFSD